MCPAPDTRCVAMPARAKVTEDDLKYLAYLVTRTPKPTLSAVAEKLRVSPSHIANLVRRAESLGMLTYTPKLMLAEEDRRRCEVRDGLRGLVARLRRARELRCDGERGAVKTTFQDIYLVEGGGPTILPRQRDGLRSVVGRKLDVFWLSAGRVLPALLARSRERCVGIAWGPTLAGVVNGLEKAYQVRRKERPIRFVATAGDVVGRTARGARGRELRLTGDSSSLLARRMDEIVNRSVTHAHTDALDGIPALIPADFLGSGLDMIWQYISGLPSYQAIFGEKGSIDRIDTLFTSIGITGRQLRMQRTSLVETLSARPEIRKAWELRFKADILGDIAGVMIPREQGAAGETSRRIASLWTGIRHEHLERISAKASFDRRSADTRESEHFRRPAGVVAFLIVKDRQANKAQLALELIKAGLVNNLVTDVEMVNELARRLDEEERAAARAPSGV